LRSGGWVDRGHRLRVRDCPRGVRGHAEPTSPGWHGDRRIAYARGMAGETYKGSCHCGKVTYRVELDLTRPVIACNCTMCRRSGTLLSFVPVDAFQLESGADELTGYKFNKHLIDHVFCRGCGIKSFARGKSKDGAEMIAINVRCLPDVDLESLQVMQYDGASV
jgi:hypothetical protein